MVAPALPANEKERLTALQETQLLGSPPEAEFDNITKLASFICKTPISMISLVGESSQWIKSKVGTNLCESDRDISFCSHAILEPGELMEIQDTRKDHRFEDNPFVISDNDPILYYAGMPLKDYRNQALGTLCVIDNKPNKLNKEQVESLKALATQVEMLIELKRKNHHLQEVKNELDQHNAMLKDFAGVVSHDMKMPLANMIITADVLKAKYGKLLDEEGLRYLKNLKQSGLNLSEYISGLLMHYESDKIAEVNSQDFDFNHMLEEIIDLLNITADVEINLPEENIHIRSNRAALEQIFLNLLSNSLKYNTNDKIIINITFSQDDDFYNFSIKDNGIGIPKEKQGEIFNIFTTLAVTDRNGNKGNGIGLSTVKRLVNGLGGKIEVSSKPGEHTTFFFSVKRNF